MGLFGGIKNIMNGATPKEEKKKIELPEMEKKLDTVLVGLSKTGKVNLTKHVAKVAVAMDYSGSMDSMYRTGKVQDTITRLLPLALRFDDNGELESWMFSNGFMQIDPVTRANYVGYVESVMLRCGMRMSGTEYAPALRDIVDYYNSQKDNVPAFIIFITDGDNSDKKQTDKIIRELSHYNMFIQFVGIGSGSFSYLQKLDDLDGRECDNTGFIAVKDIAAMDDAELYTELLRQYKDWLSTRS